MDKYDYIVVNETNKVAECAADIHQIINDEKKKAVYCEGLIRENFPKVFPCIRKENNICYIHHIRI